MSALLDDGALLEYNNQILQKKTSKQRQNGDVVLELTSLDDRP